MISLRKKAAVAALAATLVGGFEGVRQYAYKDPVGIPTICFGETKGVRMGQHRTMEECRGMLLESLYIADDAVVRCVNVDLPDKRRIALVSFAYNIGGGAFCSSTLVKKLNAGDVRGACNQLLRWDKSRGIRLPGLTKRRTEERELCLT